MTNAQTAIHLQPRYALSYSDLGNGVVAVKTALLHVVLNKPVVTLTAEKLLRQGRIKEAALSRVCYDARPSPRSCVQPVSEN